MTAASHRGFSVTLHLCASQIRYRQLSFRPRSMNNTAQGRLDCVRPEFYVSWDDRWNLIWKFA